MQDLAQNATNADPRVARALEILALARPRVDRDRGRWLTVATTNRHMRRANGRPVR